MLCSFPGFPAPPAYIPRHTPSQRDTSGRIRWTHSPFRHPDPRPPHPVSAAAWTAPPPGLPLWSSANDSAETHCPGAVPGVPSVSGADCAPPPHRVSDSDAVPPVPACRARAAGWDRSDRRRQRSPYPPAHMPKATGQFPVAPASRNRRKMSQRVPTRHRQSSPDCIPVRGCCESLPAPWSARTPHPAAVMNQRLESPAFPVPDIGFESCGTDCTAADHRTPQCRCVRSPAVQGVPAAAGKCFPSVSPF